MVAFHWWRYFYVRDPLTMFKQPYVDFVTILTFECLYSNQSLVPTKFVANHKGIHYEYRLILLQICLWKLYSLILCPVCAFHNKYCENTPLLEVICRKINGKCFKNYPFVVPCLPLLCQKTCVVWITCDRICWKTVFILHVVDFDNSKKPFQDLLGLCEIKRGKDNKAIIASNIMYIVGQYPRFLRYGSC